MTSSPAAEWVNAISVVVLVGVTAYYALTSSKILKAVQRQTNMLERSTAATEKSVKLQEVAMRQWVSIENWNGQIVTREGKRLLEFKFDIVNRTKSPLRLEFITTNAHGCATQQRADHVLGPEKEFSVTRVTGPLSEEQQSKLRITIAGAVTYEDVFEERRTQRFNATCSWSTHSGFFFYQYEGTQESGSEQT